MKKKLTVYDRNVIKWEKRDVWIDVVLAAFETPIKYDYIIPDACSINDKVKHLIKLLRGKIPRQITEQLGEITFAYKEEYSSLMHHLIMAEHIFGHEWFYGHGTLYRWRSGQKEECIKRINKYIPESQMPYVIAIQHLMRLSLEEIKKVDLNQLIPSKKHTKQLQ